MKHTYTVLVLALSVLSTHASASDLGVLGAQPQIQSWSISAADVTFSTPYTFTLATDSVVSATATPMFLLIGDSTIWGTTDFSFKLYDTASHNLLAVASAVNGVYHISNVSLRASQYFFDMSGRTIGLSGGSYVFTAAALTSYGATETPAVPEPSAMTLLMVGLGAIGMSRLRRTESV